MIKETSKALESAKSTLDIALPALDFLLEQFEAFRTEYTGNIAIEEACDACWKKLDKYYLSTDQSTAYTAAVCLHPSSKMAYFERTWAEHPAWVTSANTRIRELWESRSNYLLF